ncbi:MAG: hypothetical protein K1X94_11415 [Sandaracinaceae bacterium]|nr:hypothetical protein [Sandaracinaceae bacterium]
MRSRTWFAALLALAVSATAGACGGPSNPDAGAAPDVQFDDTARRFDAGPPCMTDADCDDGVMCTMDRCGDDGLCQHQVDPASCDDGIFCNGQELCDPRRDCVPGPRETCDDGDVCTVDRCNEERKTCDRAPRDLDADGDPDFFCMGGTDCDDFDPTRNGMVAEVCEDLVDNDCDTMVDEPDCGRPAHDVCDDALVIDASGTYVFETGGAAPDYTIGCTAGVRQDMVAALVIPADGPRDVSLELQGDFFVTALSLRTECAVTTTETTCRSGYPATVRARALEPGTYYLILSSLGGPGEMTLTVELNEPTAPPMNETCASATEVPFPAGGTYTGSFIGVVDDAMLECGSSSQPDLFYTFTIPEGQSRNVNVSLTSHTGDGMSFAVLDGCAGSTLRCAYGSPAQARTYRLGPGTYVVAIEGPSWVEVDYDLSVVFEPASDPVTGDLCATAIPVTPGTTYTGTLVGAEDDVAIECSYRAPDMIHRVTLTDDADVTIVVDGGRSYLSTAISTTCPIPSGMSSLFCSSGLPARARIRGLSAGDYYVYVEGTRAGAYTLDITATSPPASVLEVSGNENCATATVIPATGGLFHGSTVTLMHDYTPTTCGSSGTAKDAVFSLTLTSRQHVVASTAGSTIDTVMYMLGGSCSPELACDDDGAGSGDSLLDRTLEAGTYYFVVDAFSSATAGDYFLEVLVEPAP